MKRSCFTFHTVLQAAPVFRVNAIRKPSNDKLEAAWISLVVTTVLVAAKLAVGLATGSLAILSLAAESGIDLAAVLITVLAVRISSTPPDADHPYGHGKFESLSALAQGLLLLGATAWIVLHAASHLSAGKNQVTVNGWSFAVLIVSVLLDGWRGQFLHGAGKVHRSSSLEASAIHFLTDALSAVIAAIALLLVKFANIPEADDWAAIVVGAFVAYLSVRIILNAVDGLTDRYTRTGDYDRVTAIVERVPGVEGVNDMRMRTAGPTTFIEISVALSRVLPLSAIERILAEVERAVRQDFPHSDVTVHWQPIRTKNERPFETIKMVIAEHGLLPHNTELSRMKDGKIELDYHLEFRPGESLADATAVSNDIQSRIREELPQVGPIFVHLEEERSDTSLPKIEEAGRSELIDRITGSAMRSNEQVRRVLDVHLFRDSIQHAKLVITVELASTLSLHSAHEIVTALEETLKKEFPELTRIVVQAKPAANA